MKRNPLDFLPREDKLTQFGSIIFGVGLLIVIIGSMIQLSSTATTVTIGILVVFGFLVGLLNVTRQEAQSFLIASLVLVLLLGQFALLVGQYFLPTQSESLIKMLTLFNALIIPAAIIVAFRVFFFTAKDK